MGLVRLFRSLQSFVSPRADESTPLGDTYDSPGILKFQSYIEEMHPGIFIHSVYIDPDSKEDKRATFVSSELIPVAFTTAHLCLHKFVNSMEMLTTKWNSLRSNLSTCLSCQGGSMQ